MASEGPNIRDEGPKGPEELTIGEKYWKEQYDWLLDAGYRLRSRYKADWEPSWAGTNWNPYDCEDAQKSWFNTVNFAIRVETGRFVTLKQVDRVKHPDEAPLMLYLMEEDLLKDPNNHVVPLINVLQHPEDPNTCFLVLPLLRDFDDPEFQTMGEAIDFISQFFTGVQFLHQHGVSHGDLSINNILMDAHGMFPDDFHPCYPIMKADWSGRAKPGKTRTEKPPKYYLIDYGQSERFYEDETPVTEHIGTDDTVPEYEDESQVTNPFFVDVYCAGNMIKYEFLDGDPQRIGRTGYHGFEFLRSLIDDMTRQNSTERPTMPEVVKRFDEAVKTLSTATLRSRCIKKRGATAQYDEPWPLLVVASVHHWYKKITYIVRRLPAVPQS
ncbi:hypothetical protein D9611_003035 [Ephemerocybe angulata]|uniref:Kinase-like domain-containing protein n=2 Tax=Ephemerocybe angulata TaxID=980116 RepID=A0A8H6LUD4_9AGAR|nr:hypothetical protein D9611_003035 [Tulosesus angulatus]KAF6743030.1 kinase-like domain-containing protein [Tulosesus angulatus]